MKIEVLYEDNHLIAVYKPAGILVQAGEDGGHDDDTLYWQIKEFLKKRDQKPGNVFLGVLHRLDRNVSGIVLFAKTSKGAARLSEQFREHTIVKIYHALVEGIPVPASARLEHGLVKDEAIRKTAIDSEGDESVLHYDTVSVGPRRALLKIKLETGRFHQIRAQLSAIGHPIVGDVKYGAPTEILRPAKARPRNFSEKRLPDNSLALCATELHFTTATTDELKTISIPIPPQFLDLISL